MSATVADELGWASLPEEQQQMILRLVKDGVGPFKDAWEAQLEDYLEAARSEAYDEGYDDGYRVGRDHGDD